MTEQQRVGSKPIAVSVPLEMVDFLDKHTEINRSKIFQDAVFKIMHPELNRVSSQIVLMMFMNFIIAMALIFVSLWMPVEIANQNTQYLKLILIFLGLILTVVSMMTYRYEKMKIKRL